MTRKLRGLGGFAAVALVAMVPVFAVEAAPATPQAAPNAAQSAPTQAAPAQAAPAAPVANPNGATSSGGSFYVAPVDAKGQPRATAQGGAIAAAEVPEPAMVGLFGAGLIGLAFARMRARRKQDDAEFSAE